MNSKDRKQLYFVLLAVTITIGYSYLSEDVKKISYQKISQSEIISGNHENIEGLKIFLDEIAINSLNSTIIHVQNTGSLPITSNDFEAPIEIHLSTAGEILKADIILSYPGNLNPVITQNESIISINPLLLNPGDGFQIGILTSSIIESLNFSSRISGINSIQEEDIIKSKTMTNKEKTLLFSLSLILILLYTAVNSSDKASPNFNNYKLIHTNELLLLSIFIFIPTVLSILAVINIFGINNTWLQIFILVIILATFNEVFKRLKSQSYQKIEKQRIN